jgi:hypothetical protein
MKHGREKVETRRRGRQRWVRYFDSREHQLGAALLDAAVERHPGWRDLGNGRYKKSKGAPDEHIEWFFKTYPLEAREIERRFPPEARS